MKRLQFQKTITLGSIVLLVPIVGILGTALATFWSIGREVQRTQDAIATQQSSIVHETEIRQALLTSLTDKIGVLTAQEARDVTVLNQSIIELRQDIRAARPK